MSMLQPAPQMAAPNEIPVSSDEIMRNARWARAAAMAAFVAGIVGAVRRWNARRRTTVALRELDDRILADIGLSRAEIGQIARGHYVVDHSATYVTKIPAATVEAPRTGQRAA